MRLTLYIVRHASAFPRDPLRWPNDGERPLTQRGEQRFRVAARGLKRVAEPPDLVLSSPLTRAWHTAVILEEEAGWPAPTRCDALESGVSPEAGAAALERQRGSVRTLAIVGHEPQLHQLISYLTTGLVDRLQVMLKKGSASAIVFEGARAGIAPGAAVLEWILTPKMLRMLAHPDR